jgi:hypothetical protein
MFVSTPYSQVIALDAATSQHLTVPVRLKGIRIERSREFGDVYLALALWRVTGLAQLCEELLPAGKEHVAWEKMTLAGRVWIADRGMASADYLAWRRQSGRRYIIGAPKSELRKFSAPLAEAAGRREIREGIEVKLTPCPETGETVILVVRSSGAAKRAVHEKFSRPIEVALGRLAARIARSSKRLDPTQVNRQIGRILQQNQRAAVRFEVRLEDDGGPAEFRLHVECNVSFDDWAALSKGAYLLRSNITDWSDEQLFAAIVRGR